VTITSDVYRLFRSELMLLTAREYLRSFWWFAIATPLFGVLAVVFGTGLLQVVGMMAILWPFSIPARAVMTTTKSARLFTGGCRMEASIDQIVFLGEKSEPKRLRMILEPFTIRDLVQRGDFLLIRTRRLGFVPVRSSALGDRLDDFKALFEKMIAQRDADLTS
jgi:hypothetical protein